jgi:hypothetical protein
MRPLYKFASLIPVLLATACGGSDDSKDCKDPKTGEDYDCACAPPSRNVSQAEIQSGICKVVTRDRKTCVQCDDSDYVECTDPVSGAAHDCACEPPSREVTMEDIQAGTCEIISLRGEPCLQCNDG